MNKEVTEYKLATPNQFYSILEGCVILFIVSIRYC